MKKIAQILSVAIMLTAVLGSCKKDEQRVIFNAGTSPVLASSVTGNIPLGYATAGNEALSLTWSNPNYQFNTGVSSYDVSYQMEIDTTGSNFTNPGKKVIAINKNLSTSISQGEFNDYLLNQLQLAPAISHNMEIRVKSFLIGGTGTLYSNVLKLTATPYSIPPKVTPPSSGRLFIVGDATPGGWGNPVPPAQEFTKIDDLHYQITMSMVGGNAYLFLPVNGSWDHKFACAKTSDQNLSGGSFGFDFGGNFPAPASSGNYKILVDFQRGMYTVSPL